MSHWGNLSSTQLKQLLSDEESKYEAFKTRGLTLDLSRGKPSPDVLDLSDGLLGALDTKLASDDTDIRNYGMPYGLPECKKLFSDLLGIPTEKITIGGNSSLALMYGVFTNLYLFGAPGGVPWSRCEKVKILCPCPGYDRHFTLTDDFGAEMITVPMTDNGPDMDIVEKLAATDASVKGIWCVPLYSNPGGVVYSEETAQRLASMKTAAPDFRIFWDNAYGVHHLFEEHTTPDILALTESAGHPERAFYFFSTSKINYPSGGLSFVASGSENVEQLRLHLGKQTIGYDKIIQLRTVKFFGGDAESIRAHMKKIAHILRPKFELVLSALDREFSDTELLTWTPPKGGYFVSVNTRPGCAKRVVALAKDAGAILTDAGATYPYGADPEDANIRIAPTYPTLDELAQMMELFTICVRIASIEKLLKENA